MKVKDMASRVGFVLQKNAPDILTGVGIVGFITSSVLIGRASMKLEGQITELKDNLKIVDRCLEEKADSYSEEDAKKDRIMMYTHASIKIAKLYTPAVSIGMISIGCVLKSHYIMKNRMLSLSAAYATLAVGYKAYQDRVAAKYGEEAEKEIRYNINTVTTEETVIGKKGKETTVVTETKVMDAQGMHSPYAKIFDESNMNFERDSEINVNFLTAQQRFANDKLHARGHLFLNEVYDMLGFPRTKAGQVVGWIWDKKNEGLGDNYIDFGIFNFDNPRAADFVNGYEKSVILDFNVDGNIWDRQFETIG